ncbi:reverse transcriptase domain-containing protein [Tanacetum coccineum]
MCTRSSSNLIVESSTIPKRRNRRRSKQIVKPEIRTIVETPVVTMADTRTMSELLLAPTEGYKDAIVIPAILAEKFELKVGAIKLMLFPFSLEGAARIWHEKEPPRSILTWEDLVSKFVNYFFPPSKTTNLKNDITNFQQKFEETFSETWDRFKELLHKCPHHGFLEIAQNRYVLQCVDTIRSRFAKCSRRCTTTSSLSPSLVVTALTEMVKELVLMNKANQQASMKVVDEICVTCGGPHPYYDCLATDINTFNAYAATRTYNQGGPGYRPQGDPNYRASNQMGPPGFPSNVQNNQNYNQNQGNNNYQAPNFQALNYQAPNNQGRGQNINQGNNNYQASNYQAQVGTSNELTNYMKSNKATLRAMQTQMTNMKKELLGGVSYDGPMILPTPSPLPKEVERETEATKDKVQNTSLEGTAHVQPPVVQDPIPEPEVALKPNTKPLHFNLSFADALLHIPKFASSFKSLLTNKEKLFELANTPLNENCSAVLLKKLPEKLGDPGKFLIPCDFPELHECLALADLGNSINLMPLSIWKKLSLPELTPTRMILELVNRSVAVPEVNDEAITFNVGHTSRYSRNYYDEMVHQVNGIDVAYEEYTQEVLGFSNSSMSGNPTPLDPIIASFSTLFTPFEGGDFILEEIKACLSSDSIPPGINDTDFDLEGDIRLLEKLLNDDPSSPLPPKELNLEELKTIKSSIDDPPELELKDLPSHLEYAFLEKHDKYLHK